MYGYILGLLYGLGEKIIYVYYDVYGSMGVFKEVIEI